MTGIHLAEGKAQNTASCDPFKLCLAVRLLIIDESVSVGVCGVCVCVWVRVCMHACE